MPKVRRPTLVVRNVLVGEDDALLLGRRADCELWEFPGGKVDDEAYADAARREQLEETGMRLLGEPALLGVAEGFSQRKPDRRFVEIFLGWRRWAGYPRRVEPNKCLGWRWFGVKELPAADALTVSARAFVAEILPTTDLSLLRAEAEGLAHVGEVS
jgi:8-oxo-dGTP diphosphatase